MLITQENMVRVTEVVKIGDVILHKLEGGILRRGDRVKGIVDEERRWSLMRHHTATHLLLRASKEVLGAHIHQAGAQKGVESSRIDIRHFRHITADELQKIEMAANRMVLADTCVEIKFEDRVRAEQAYGFSLYQGGVPPGRELRIVSVAGDIEACAGTHCMSTGQIGMIKIMRVEHIQDGIERLEFSAGLAALRWMYHIEEIVNSSAEVFSVQPDNLPATSQRFFTEWKNQKKENEKLSQKLVELEMAQIQPEMIKGVQVVVKRLDLPAKDLMTVAARVSGQGGVAFLLSKNGERVEVVLTSGSGSVNAGEIIGQVTGLLGGKGGGTPALGRGGGPAIDQMELAMKVGRERIVAALNS
jgi:alanyl-tRNA synthetase